jgi:ubiquinone/menaquinone biosynthesis C-methylase UbiE
LNSTKENIQDFWRDTCKQWYVTYDKKLNSTKLNEDLDHMVKMFSIMEHLAVTEMERFNLQGKLVLEIGSGSGAHSAYFKKLGAKIVSVDITPERINSTAHKLSLMEGEPSFAFIADAENLPFKDCSFDVVYSNGVLHHAENTDNCINEVYRVLKPGAMLVIMLYARYSFLYLLNLLPKAIITGNIFRFPEGEWMGRITEGTPKYKNVRNPITRCYSKKELNILFSKFDLLSLRKNGFYLSQLPLVEKFGIRNSLLKILGYQPHKGSRIVYGEDKIMDSILEIPFRHILGNNWNILAQKLIV